MLVWVRGLAGGCLGGGFPDCWIGGQVLLGIGGLLDSNGH
jgi:hypothetical protein